MQSKETSYSEAWNPVRITISGLKDGFKTSTPWEPGGMKYHMSDYLNHVRGFSERGLTIGQIQIIRSWLSAKGFENQLVIVRENDRNRIYIRVMLAEPVDFEAAWLFSLRSERPTRQKLADLFMERMQVA